jgi:hypothetical protein
MRASLLSPLGSAKAGRQITPAARGFGFARLQPRRRNASLDVDKEASATLSYHKS